MFGEKAEKNGCFVVWTVKSGLLFALAVLPDTHLQPHAFSLLCHLMSSSFFFFDETEYLWFMMTSVWLISKPCSLCHETAGFCSYDILCSLHVVQYNFLSNKEYLYSDKFHGKLGAFKRSCKTCLNDRESTDQNGGTFFFIWCWASCDAVLSLSPVGCFLCSLWLLNKNTCLQSQHIK